MNADSSSYATMNASPTPLRAEDSFTISAVHSVRSEKSLPRIDPSGHWTGYLHRGSLSKPAYSLVATSSSAPLPLKKDPPPEIAAIDKELQRMFKLQLGPLTIASDIPPIMDVWLRLQDARTLHGRKAIAATWVDLSRATAIVSKKMTTTHITRVIDAQFFLMYPCPRTLRLPADMLTALASRARIALASSETHEELLQYSISVGRLMDGATTMHISPVAPAVSSDHWLKALSRAATVMPLIEAGMEEAARRAERAAEKFAATVSSTSGASKKRDVVERTLLVAEMLAELAGSRISALVRCLNQAALVADQEQECAQAAVKAQPWWKKVAVAAKKGGGGGGVRASFEQVLPSHTDMGTQQASRLAGKAAERLAYDLLPVALPSCTPEELMRLAIALRDATTDDAGSPSHEHLRQALSLVLTEAVRRASLSMASPSPSSSPLMNASGINNNLTKICVREVVVACRKRLLHLKFSLMSPECGLAAALATLEAWKGARKLLQKQKEKEVHAHVHENEYEKEAHSLELHSSLEGEEGQEGEEAESRRDESGNRDLI